jgi:exopolysaccharide biosynthesis polyprenyl glycosylphosphotransferase
MAESTRSSSWRLRPGDQRALIIFGDLVASTLAVIAALYTWRRYSFLGLIAQGLTESRAQRVLDVQVQIWFYLLPIIWVMLMVDTSNYQVASNWRKTLAGVTRAALVGFIIYSFIYIISKEPTNTLPRIGVGAFLIFTSVLTLVWRAAYIRIFIASGMLRRILVVGAGKAGKTLMQVYKELDPPPFSIVGFIDDDPKKQAIDVLGYPVLGGSERLLEIIEDKGVSNLIIAVTGEIQGATFQTILDAQERGLEVTRMPRIYEEITGRVPIHHLESDWLIRSFVDDLIISNFYEIAKRLLDILGGLVGILLLLILLPFIALAIVIDTGWPIFYTQDRLGKGGKEFSILKFRTMIQNAEADGQARLASENDPRITRVGNFLRKARLDEFPQFYNVLRGEMSLVGPRAERDSWVQHFQNEIPFYRARLLVKPGLTGWAQVNYDYVSTVEDTAVKLEYDLYYIKHRSLVMDIKILFRTVGTVLKLRGR